MNYILSSDRLTIMALIDDKLLYHKNAIELYIAQKRINRGYAHLQYINKCISQHEKNKLQLEVTKQNFEAWCAENV